MTKGELLKALEGYDDEQYVYVGSQMRCPHRGNINKMFIIQDVYATPPWHGKEHGTPDLIGLLIHACNGEISKEESMSLDDPLVELLLPHAGERGDNEDAVECLKRIIRERDEAQHNHKAGTVELVGVEAVGKPGPGGAHHEYRIHFDKNSSKPSPCFIYFQNGPIREVGRNGVTEASLLYVVLDRLRSFQAGPYSCRENALAITKIEEALHWIYARTRDREQRGVEGTSKIGIIVNGKNIAFAGTNLSYADAVSLAGYPSNRVLSVTVEERGKEGKSLTPGQEVEITDGAIINVADTSNA